MGERDLRELQAEIERLKARLTEVEGRSAACLRVPSSRRARLALVGTVVVVVLLLTATAYAGDIVCEPWHVFVNGTIADANDVNENFECFDAVRADSTAQDSRMDAHEADVNAHHVKTTSFSDLGDSATDGQIPDDITIIYANTAGNADTLDALDSTNFALSGHQHDDRYYSRTYVDALEARIAALEALLVDVSRGGTPDTLTFSGMNVQVIDGSGNTWGGVNGLGNLIVGYNENTVSATRTGSHNLIVGRDHEYTSYGGLVAGRENTISGVYSGVSGGRLNIASANYSSVSGGHENTASGYISSVSGGYGHTASGDYSSVSGGHGNEAGGYMSSVSGGYSNSASGRWSSISAGSTGVADGELSSVSGGYGHTASGDYSSVSGGRGNEAGGAYSGVCGGQDMIATAWYSAAAGPFRVTSLTIAGN